MVSGSCSQLLKLCWRGSVYFGWHWRGKLPRWWFCFSMADKVFALGWRVCERT